MRRCIVILCILSVLMMCSWVDPETVDVYNGQIVYVDTQNLNVTRLSGNIQYWLVDYHGISYDSSGHLFNSTNTIKLGTALINGIEYDVRVNSLGGFQIEQTYYAANNVQRTSWITYNLTPEVLPTNFNLPEFAIIAMFILVFLLVCINIVSKGFF